MIASEHLHFIQREYYPFGKVHVHVITKIDLYSHCEMWSLGTQHSSSLMSVTWVRCKDNIYVLSWFSPVLIEAQSWRKLRGRFTTWDLSATVVHKMLILCLLACIHLWASQSSAATTVSSQVSSHQYAALQQGRGEKADYDFMCHQIYCAHFGVA